MKRVLFYCQPVLGIGHLVRSLEILRGLSGFEIWFVNGGEPLTDLELPANVSRIDLPPIRSDAEFREIAPLDGTASIGQIKMERKRLLLDAFARVAPDILLIELFPFGRLKFEFELIPLLEAARRVEPRVTIACSLRDILVAKSDQDAFDQFVISTINRYFDLILVHSDPTFQPLEETFPRLSELRCRVEYTGYVAQPVGEGVAGRGPGRTIIASIGGGRVGVELLRCTIAASRLLRDELPHELRIFTGPYLPGADFATLLEEVGDDASIHISRFTSCFVDELRAASLSISMAGYNTCMNIVTTGVRAIVSPFTGNRNREQSLRAERLEAAGILRVIPGNQLTPENLARLIREELTRRDLIPHRTEIDLDGAARTAQLLREISNR